MNSEARIKLFRLSHEMLERDLDRVETACSVDLGRGADGDVGRDDEYYPQFDGSVRSEAAAMAAHYELFYCLERSLRAIIRDALQAKHPAGWWTAAVPEAVRTEVEKAMQAEIESAVTRRSTEEIDYTTFGQLGEIVRSNWESFADTFSSLKGFNKVMASLNVLRGPIAHCCPLAADEALRLRLTVADFFRLMS